MSKNPIRLHIATSLPSSGKMMLKPSDAAADDDSMD
jgi:hypothetical protein